MKRNSLLLLIPGPALSVKFIAQAKWIKVDGSCESIRSLNHRGINALGL